MAYLLYSFLLFFFCFPAKAQELSENLRTFPAIAMHGDVKYDSDFTHFDYVNPKAPKGGELKLHAIGAFNSLNGHIIKGIPASGLGLIQESLMEQSLDEPFSMYGLLAESITLPEDRSWVQFTLREKARWQDGKPVTAEDVKWSFKTLLEKGKPFYRTYYTNIESVEILNEKTIKFFFNTTQNRELPLIVGQLPIFPKHYWTSEGRVFGETTLEPPLGSGPYKIGDVVTGRSITYERDTNWWGADLPINQGRYNFDKITYEYYRDSNVALEAFLGQDYHYRLENTAKLWATAYDTPAVRNGQIIKEKVPNELPQGMQGFIFNTRRAIFADPAVREALAYAFDFEWSNKQFAYGAYTRSRSYFSNSEMAAKGLPEGRELAILEEYRDQLPARLFEEEYQPPKSGGSGQNRRNLRKAQNILAGAGYKIGPDGIRTDDEGNRLSFEFVDNNPAFERWVLPFIQNLKKIGVDANFKVVDPAQYQKRMTDYDFDMTVTVYAQSSSPGNEQREYWGSDKANVPGSRNYIGIQDPVVDALIQKIVTAQSRKDLVVHAKALDRVLQWGFYVIPNWHLPAWRIAYWNHLGRPTTLPDYDLAVSTTWWAKKND